MRRSTPTLSLIHIYCGTNIAATVDVEKVAQTLGKEPGVVFATDYPYMCSQTGQQMIQDKIHELGLTGVVICSCSPRMHEQTFRTVSYTHLGGCCFRQQPPFA